METLMADLHALQRKSRPSGEKKMPALAQKGVCVHFQEVEAP